MIPIAVLAVSFFAWERLAPARPLPRVPGWAPRVVLANVSQFAAVLAVGPLCERAVAPLFPLDGLPAPAAGLLVYLLSTLLWYAWHRARHGSRALWLGFHQLHHSPSRIEVAMAFYKHPLEQIANALLSGAIAGPLFGLSPGAALVYATLSAAAEFVYHSNVRTPRWLGYFVQRPEMHRVHHARGQHTCNYSDLPLWDLLFGTFYNPEGMEGDCGFEPAQEIRVGAMLGFQDVVARTRTTWRQVALAGLTLLGVSAVGGTVLTPLMPRVGPALAALGKVSLVSPFPRVFSAMPAPEASGSGPMFAAGAPAEEPWAYTRTATVTFVDGSTRVLPFDDTMLDDPVGPYMLRNAYGAAVAYGPWMPEETADAVLRHVVCVDPTFRPALAGGDPTRRVARVALRAEPGAGLMGPVRTLEVECS
jgi:sterol desaturase/sphingolipid hydroxylase (fatty acid hydroxylase superfamily)